MLPEGEEIVLETSDVSTRSDGLREGPTFESVITIIAPTDPSELIRP